MTERKPVGVAWESWVEKKIREAREEGRLQGLAGEGRPLPDVDEPYDPLWWTKKLIRRERISDVPPAMAIRRRVEAEMERLLAASDEQTLREGLEALNREIGRINATVTSGPSTSVAPLDINAVIRRWRRKRRGE